MYCPGQYTICPSIDSKFYSKTSIDNKSQQVFAIPSFFPAILTPHSTFFTLFCFYPIFTKFITFSDKVISHVITFSITSHCITFGLSLVSAHLSVSSGSVLYHYRRSLWFPLIFSLKDEILDVGGDFYSK